MSMLERILFSTDRTDVRGIHQFTRYADQLRAMSKLTGSIETCLGMYEGVPELSFMCLVVDFDEHIRDSGFVSEQECFLRIPGDTRQPCVLEFQHTGVRQDIGPMKLVSNVWDYESWTFHRGKYYVCSW